MTQISYPTNSPYSNTPQYSWRIDSMTFRPVQPNSGDVSFTLTETYNCRPDRLSQDLYGSPAYWWVFAARNPFLRKAPVWGFVTGLVIAVPSAQYISAVVG